MALMICYPSWVERLERRFIAQLRASDFKNASITDRLEKYLVGDWTVENSFCLDDQQNLSTAEAYIGYKGLCFTINGDKIFNQETYLKP